MFVLGETFTIILIKTVIISKPQATIEMRLAQWIPVSVTDIVCMPDGTIIVVAVKGSQTCKGS